MSRCVSGMVGLAPKWVRLAPNGTNPGLFQIRLQCIWRGAPNALKSDLKKPRICSIWGQSDPLWSQTYHPWLKLLAQDVDGIISRWVELLSRITRSEWLLFSFRVFLSFCLLLFSLSISWIPSLLFLGIGCQGETSTALVCMLVACPIVSLGGSLIDP